MGGSREEEEGGLVGGTRSEQFWVSAKLSFALCCLQLALPSFPALFLRRVLHLPFSFSFLLFFFCASAFPDGFCYGELGRRRGLLVMGPTFGFSLVCGHILKKKKKKDTGARIQAHKHTPAAVNTREATRRRRRRRDKGCGDKQRGRRGRWRGQHGTLFRGNLTAQLLHYLPLFVFPCSLCSPRRSLKKSRKGDRNGRNSKDTVRERRDRWMKRSEGRNKGGCFRDRKHEPCRGEDRDTGRWMKWER